MDKIEARSGAEDFWKEPEAAQKLLQRRKRLESDLDLLKRLQRQEDDTRVLVEWLEGGEDVEKDLGAALDALEQTLEGAEFQKMLGGEHDRANAILTINSGAGGTESQDWAEMLLRMYMRWCDRKGYKRDLIDLQAGEEAGIKSATVLVQGEYAYGYLSAEVGVHRLVRISPFDSAARRHTSFASVFVWPELDEDIKIDVQDKELRIDTYRSSGAGGKHVNVTDSARTAGVHARASGRDGASVSARPPESSVAASRDFVYERTVRGNQDLYVIPAGGGVERRLTDHPATDALPRWSRDGQWVYFTSDRSGNW